MDFRFHAKLPVLLAEHFGVERFEYDSPGGCGGSLSLIDGSSRYMMLRAVELGMSLHGVRRLIIVDHVDCGACGGSARFAHAGAERAFHEARLREARDIVRQHHPELEIVLFYQDHHGITLVK
jgi:hypothetical protein